MEKKIESLRAPMRATHRSGLHLTYEWRVRQLKALQQVVSKHHAGEWLDALYQDLGKERTEAALSELVLCQNEVEFMLQHLKQWMAPHVVPGPAHCIPSHHTVTRKPLVSPGVLVVGPFNYPLQLMFLPAAGSLAGGNPTLLKPSELCPAVSALWKKLVDKYMEPGALQVIEGGVEETTALLKEQWGMVFFTGSERVGKIVAQATAKTLTPTVLELGGKAPVVVDELAPKDMTTVANRIIWGKTLNAGQTCVAPDYVVCHHSHVDRLCQELIETLKRQFGTNPRESEFGRIVSEAHAQRQVDLLKEVESDSTAQIIYGGSALCDPAHRYVCPTIVVNPPRNSRLLHEEIFGPILPIVTVESREEAIEFINDMHGTPLAFYVFTKSEQVYQDVVAACPAASAMRNDVVLHFSSPHLPVGGLGTSGYGNYHGKFSFDTFTHAFASVYRPCSPGMDFGMVRYHPFKGFKGHTVLCLMRLPEIPVMHTKWLLTALGVFFVLYHAPVTVTTQSPWMKSVANHAAEFLVSMADRIRSTHE